MSYSETSAIPQGRFWPSLGRRLPLNKTSWLAIATVTIVAAAVFFTWMLAAGPWSGADDSHSNSAASRSDAALEESTLQSKSAPAGGFGDDSTMTVTVTDGGFESESRPGLAAPSASQPPEPSGAMVANGAGERQIISQGSMSVEVGDVSFAAARVRAIAEGVGGFVEQLSSNGVGEVRQSALTVRVPQAEFFSVFEQIKELGEVQNENAGSNDVTEQFIDLVLQRQLV